MFALKIDYIFSKKSAI